jgi:hypothetical protein
MRAIVFEGARRILIVVQVLWLLGSVIGWVARGFLAPSL